MARDDKRRYPRHRLAGIEGTLRSPRDVRVVNLSLTGMALETSTPMTVGERYFIELTHRQHTVNVEVEVQWCSKVRQGQEEGDLDPVFRAGGSFVDIYRDSPGGIWDWILSEKEETEA